MSQEQLPQGRRRRSPADETRHQTAQQKDGGQAADEGGHSRRSFLKRAGLGALLVGAGAGGGQAVAHLLRPDVPPRTVFGQAEPVRIDNVTIVDPLDGSRAPGMSILVEAGRVAAVLPVGSVPAEASSRVIDGAGRFAVPGYNNMHTHALQAENPPLALATMLAEGVTGMRQMEGSEQMLRDRAEQRLPLTPHAPGLLEMPGALVLPFNAGTVEQVRQEIDRQWDQGADFIKMIMTDRDVFFEAVTAAHDRGLRIAGHLPPSIGIAEASAAGFDCVEHLGTSTNVWIACSRETEALWDEQDTALPVPRWVAALPGAGNVFTALMKDRLTGPATYTSAGVVDLLTRALDTYAEDRARDLAAGFVENGTWQSPTLVGTRSKYVADATEYRTDPWLEMMSTSEREKHTAAVEGFRALPDETLATFHGFYRRTLQTVGIWHDAVVPILAGTDGAGRGVASSMQREFQELAAAGLSPLDVLRSATTAPARYLHRTDRMGRIAQGTDADLLLLEADPLDSVDNLASIWLVVRGGHSFTATELDDRVEELARQDR